MLINKELVRYGTYEAGLSFSPNVFVAERPAGGRVPSGPQAQVWGQIHREVMPMGLGFA
jgi:hypothetical protein